MFPIARSIHLRGSYVLGLAGLFGTLALAACGQKAAGEPVTEHPRAVPVRGVQVTRRDLDETLIVTGTLRPRAEVKVVAEVPARLERILQEAGATVKKGDLLAVLDDTDYRLTLDRAKASLAVADANRAHASAERDRANSLLKTGGITDKDHLAAQVNLQVGDASVAQAKAEVAIAEQNVTRTRIVAPFAGRIADRLADAGTVLATGTPVFQIVDDSVLEFRGAVPSSDFAKVRINAPLTLAIDALPDLKVTGTVTRIAPLVQERNRTFEMVARVPGQAQLIGGMFARASIHVRRVPDALLVPPSAIVREGATTGEAQAFVIVDGKAERRPITLGVEQPDAIQVISGLNAGDTVVIDPPVSLSSGATVQLAQALPPQAAAEPSRSGAAPPASGAAAGAQGSK
jgi:RND family efflux transporter MFP subunit